MLDQFLVSAKTQSPSIGINIGTERVGSVHPYLSHNSILSQYLGADSMCIVILRVLGFDIKIYSDFLKQISFRSFLFSFFTWHCFHFVFSLLYLHVLAIVTMFEKLKKKKRKNRFQHFNINSKSCKQRITTYIFLIFVPPFIDRQGHYHI